MMSALLSSRITGGSLDHGGYGGFAKKETCELRLKKVGQGPTDTWRRQF